MRDFIKYWLPVILVAALIFIGSSIEGPPSLKIPHLDKGIHLAEYAVLGFLLKRAMVRGRISQELRSSLWVLYMGPGTSFTSFSFLPGE